MEIQQQFFQKIRNLYIRIDKTAHFSHDVCRQYDTGRIMVGGGGEDSSAEWQIKPPSWKRIKASSRISECNSVSKQSSDIGLCFIFVAKTEFAFI